MSGSYIGKALAFILATVFTINNSHAQSNYVVTERGPDYKVLQKITVENGTNRVHKYTELATGMNYTNAYGQWQESKEEITLLPTGGAAATQGRHKVYFPADIYNSVLEVVTSDGRHLKSRPLGVSYDDGVNTVFIAMLKHVQGYLTSSNQVTYRDAFTDFKADLVCTYRRSGFECDLVFRQQPPTPEQCGLDPDSSTLQMVTEFFNTDDPEQIPATSDEWYGLQDSTLKFGKLTMKQGKAFAIKSTNSQPSTIRSQRNSAPVYKRWLNLDGRKFLIEELPLEDLAEDLSALPLTASILKPASNNLKFATNKRAFPPAHEFTADTNQILLASADFNKEPGVVLDYTTVDSGQADYTFQSGITYFVNGEYSFGGTTTFEGGAIIKGGQLDFDDSGSIVCSANPDKPTIFTSTNDNFAGDIITGSSGIPGYDEGPILSGQPDGTVYRNMRFYFSPYSIECWANHCEVWDCQFFYFDICAIMVDGDSPSTLELHNVLFSQGYFADDGAVDVYGDRTIIAENITADHVRCFVYEENSGSVLFLTNSLVTSSILADGGASFVTNNVVYLSSPATSIYQTAASANYYLATSSPYRNVGTTAIDPDLLAELQTLTTYAPQDGGFPDTNTPDLGYHYPVNEDSDHDDLPDWWERHWFGNYTHVGSESDPSGNTLLSDYENYATGTVTNDPNIIQFTIGATNDYVNHTNVSVQLDITGGTPSFYAIFANQATTTNWLPFSTTNLTINLGTTDGVYNVVVGLKGLPAEATQSWQNYEFYLDRIKPVLTITNPVLAGATGTVIKPYLQLQGFADKPLASLSYDISNAFGLTTNQDAFVTDQRLQTTLTTLTNGSLVYTNYSYDFGTNYFQAYDVELATNNNLITLRVTDRAGNTTTTNINVVLNYDGATSPIMRLTWPTNGLELCGTNFTLRGLVDDEAASISATITSTNGGTSVITGEVERSGVLWVEDLPLTSGTNWITLNVTNAAGKSSATNFYVVKSSMTLTVTAIDGDLWSPAVTVRGTISEPTYCVWVNGVKGTNNGDDTWEAANVPVSASGVASFIVNAIPPGGGDPSMAVDVDKEPHWGIVEHHVNKTWGETDCSDGINTSTSFSSRVKDYYTVFSTNIPTTTLGMRSYMGFISDYSRWASSGGSSWAENDYMWSDIDGWERSRTSDGYDYLSPQFPWQEDSWQWLTGLPDPSVRLPSGGGPPQWVNHYFANSVHHQWHWDFNNGGHLDRDATVTARTTVKLLTGGKAKPGRRNLFCIDAWATEYGKGTEAGWVGAPVKDLPKDRLRVLGKWVGADGKLWVALPDGTEPDITVAAPAKHYNAWATPQKYKLAIGVNNSSVGVELDPNVAAVAADFCVGQYLTFSPAWSPETPPYLTASSYFHWNLPGNFFNAETTPCSSCSTDPFIDSNKLAQEVASGNWWVSGGPDASTPATYTASVGMNLMFPNGQYVSIAALGKFHMFRPTATISPQTTTVNLINDLIEFGENQLDENNEEVFVPGITFYHSITFPANFPGSYKWTQVDLNPVRQWQYHSVFYHLDQFGSGPWLDASDPYPPTFTDSTGTNMVDAPNIGSYGAYYPVTAPISGTVGSASDLFNMWMMFTPASGGHWVPIEKVEWSWSGSQTYNGSWVGGGNKGFNGGYKTEVYPEWKNILNAINWIPNQPQP